ncbi:uncharacterized protein LOC110269384 [Arachis ipaensis]|uniref:uncharacterized protein LOC110269384 n=1 Tax=Arachis ipaensis TaxID=130454 RepID=UPI000A2B2902|nr:uncharacterized protein LOC110269384 [Arachis ipaensis]
MSFVPEDQWFDEVAESPPMVITARVGTGLVKRILVDTGADSNIMFRNVFDALGLRDTDLRGNQHGVVGLCDNFIKPDGVISLPVSIGRGRGKRSLMAEFVVLRDSTAYNLILGRKTINEFGAVISTKLLLMKFVADDGSVGTIRGDLETTVACDNASLSLRKKSKEASGVFLADLDDRVDDKPRPEPEGDLEKFKVGDSDEKTPHRDDQSQWRLVCPDAGRHAGYRPPVHVTPAGRETGGKANGPKEEKNVPRKGRRGGQADDQPTRSGFHSGTRLLDLACNVVLVKKPSGKWRMCVDYSDFNKACPKDSFPLPNIDALVDATAGYRYLSFMDAYSGYNQIPMNPPDEEKTAFITPGGTYCYKVMPFGLKNAGATYQRLMNKVFRDLIGKTVEIYVDDILVKTARPEALLSDLESVFASIRQHVMMLNPLKCAFAVEAGKFLGFMITQRGVDANPENAMQSFR